MMRAIILAAMAAGLAACSPGGATGSEEELAAKIVEAQGVLDLGEETVSSVVGAQLQGVVMETPDITPEQTSKLEASIRENIEAELPALKKEIASLLSEAFDAKELQTYYDFVGSKEGETIKDRIPPVMEKSIEAADAMTTKAVDKAIAEILGASSSAAASPVDETPPVESANPTKPQ